MKKGKIVKFLLIILLPPLLLLAYSYALEPYWFEVKGITLTSHDIPLSFAGKKIVFISDVHHGPFFSRERVAEVVRRVNELKPDIIILGGDYVYKSPQYIAPCFEELKKLNASLGVFGIRGNHDHWESAEQTKQEMKQAGIFLLDNDAVWIESGRERIRLGGVGDLWENEQDINATIDATSENDYVILVSHNPDYAEDITANKVDLILSGHTHGGQVTFFGLWAPVTVSSYGNKYRSGLIDTGHTKVFVTKGVGMIGLPIRFFARPEITIITLRHQ